MRIIFCLALTCVEGFGQKMETATVVSRAVESTVKLPGEFQPYQAVDLRARVAGYVETVLVDRGSVVKKGDVLIELSAPEMKAQRAESEAREKTAESQKAEAAARLAAAQDTYKRLKTASATQGAIAGNELDQSEQAVTAAQAAVTAAGNLVQAAHEAAQAVREIESYLKITAPFAGVITDRMVHPGALAGPATGPLLRLEQNSRLRLLVAVPEAYVGGIVRGARVPFTVPAYPGRTFSGVVARVPQSMDSKTRTMPVELDVANAGALAPGMYPEVSWPVKRAGASLLVPASAVVTTTERTFVIRVTGGRAEWVNVKKGSASGELVEVAGALNAGDTVVKRGTDEVRNGAPVR